MKKDLIAPYRLDGIDRAGPAARMAAFVACLAGTILVRGRRRRHDCVCAAHKPCALTQTCLRNGTQSMFVSACACMCLLLVSF
jgi:hypothetical protein